MRILIAGTGRMGSWLAEPLRSFREVVEYERASGKVDEALCPGLA